jgi:hypothetical protein
MPSGEPKLATQNLPPLASETTSQQHSTKKQTYTKKKTSKPSEKFVDYLIVFLLCN